MVLMMSTDGRCWSFHRSRASIAEPARTFAAFHSPLDNAWSMAPMSLWRLVLRSGSVMKVRARMAVVGDSSGHRASPARIP